MDGRGERKGGLKNFFIISVNGLTGAGVGGGKGGGGGINRGINKRKSELSWEGRGTNPSALMLPFELTKGRRRSSETDHAINIIMSGKMAEYTHARHVRIV